jgi:fructokinase
LSHLYGGIEAGGTKFICSLGSSPDDIIAEVEIPTTTPVETLNSVINFFKQHENSQRPIRSLGIASFGPLDINPKSATYGYITSTPKPGWSNTNLIKPIQERLGLQVSLDTDVNGAALGEYIWGAAQGLSDFIYLTVGTGIGGGGMIKGHLLHGLVHPEMGHLMIPHYWVLDGFSGTCPYHGDCLEGLASGTAIEKRWSEKPVNLPPNHPAWNLEAHYLALGISNLICTLSPQRIITGGGIMEQPNLINQIRKEVLELLHGYIKSPPILENINSYIVKPALGRRAGVLGAIALASTNI